MFVFHEQDNGNPKRSCSLQINVRVRPSDLEDPRFLEDFYSATVSDPQVRSFVPGLEPLTESTKRLNP